MERIFTLVISCANSISIIYASDYGRDYSLKEHHGFSLLTTLGFLFIIIVFAVLLIRSFFAKFSKTEQLNPKGQVNPIREHNCPKCNGLGYIKYRVAAPMATKCSTCNGMGVILTQQEKDSLKGLPSFIISAILQDKAKCTHCEGRGYFIDKSIQSIWIQNSDCTGIEEVFEKTELCDRCSGYGKI